MKFWRIVLGITGTLFIISGVLFFFFLLALNDPEVEGESGRVSLGTYFMSLIPIIIGGIILFIQKRKIKFQTETLPKKQ